MRRVSASSAYIVGPFPSPSYREFLLIVLMFKQLIPVLLLIAAAQAHHHDNEEEVGQEHVFSVDDNLNNDDFKTEHWAKKYGKQIDQTFSGPLSFAHVTYERCLDDVEVCLPATAL